MNVDKTATNVAASIHPFLLCMGAMLLLCACSKGPSPKKVGATDSPPPFSGDMWLRWDRSARVAFVMGDLRGLWDGQGAGCGDAKLELRSLPGVVGLTPELAEKIRFQCANKFKLPARPFDSYEQVITDFYTRFPEDRGVEIQDVLQFLAYDLDAKLTAADIHKRIKIIR